MEPIEDAIKPIEIKQSFGVNQWQRKKKRYEIEEFIGSPPTHEEGGSFHQRFGKPSKSKTSYYNKLPPEYSQDTEDFASPYLGKFRNRSVSIGELGGAISVDALQGITFDDFSKHPDHSSDAPGLSMSDMSVEAQLFPQVDPLITLKWRRRDSLFKEKVTPNSSVVEGKIVQAVKDLHITSKQVTHVDNTEQGFENNILDTPKTLDVYHQQIKVVSPARVRKRSNLEEYVTSMSKPTNKSHHHTEDECYQEEEEEEVEDTSNENHQPVNEGNDTRVRKRSNLQEYLESASKPTNKSHHHAEDEYDLEEKELQRILKENERDSETLGQKMEITHQNNTNSLNVESLHLINTKDRTTEKQNNEILHEPNKPLDPLEPPVVNYIDENIADQQGAKNELKAQEAVKYKAKEGKEHKKSLLSLLAPFIPFRKLSEESESPATPKEEGNEPKSKSKAVSRFLFTEEYEEQKTSSSLETSDLSHNSEQLKSAQSNNSNDLASASNPKVKKRRPKPSALREMNVWGPSSM